MPKLKKIDLTKGEGNKHPDIVIGKSYLVKIDCQWFAGTFNNEWYGLNFNVWHGRSIQYDQPNTNASKWEEVYEIVEKNP